MYGKPENEIQNAMGPGQLMNVTSSFKASNVHPSYLRLLAAFQLSASNKKYKTYWCCHYQRSRTRYFVYFSLSCREQVLSILSKNRCWISRSRSLAGFQCRDVRDAVASARACFSACFTSRILWKTRLYGENVRAGFLLCHTLPHRNDRLSNGNNAAYTDHLSFPWWFLVSSLYSVHSTYDDILIQGCDFMVSLIVPNCAKGPASLLIPCLAMCQHLFS